MASKPLSPAPNKFVTAANEFGVHLYQTIKETRDGENMFFSPLGISTAMAMTHLGARGDTAKQIAEVFRFNKIDGDQLHQTVKKMDDALFRPLQETDEGSLLDLRPKRLPRHHFLSTANRLYANSGFPLLQSFLDDISRFYDSGIEAVDDFTSPSAIKSINDWVSERTEGKINNLLDVGMLDPLTQLVLVNSMYFKGKWDATFKKIRTTQYLFKISGSIKRISTKFMRREGHHCYVSDTDLRCKILALPFDYGINVGMMIALPDEVDGLPDLESKLSFEVINNWIAECRVRRVNVFLPKFTIKTQLDLKKALQSMGISDAFDGSRADFSGITGTRDLGLSALIHKTFVDVNEEGCEAAAVSVEPLILISGDLCKVIRPASKPVEFRADHPFLFILLHWPTNAIIFIGRLVDPSKEKNEDCHLKNKCTCC